MIRSWLEISPERIRHNVTAISRRLDPSCEIIAVVKADAYGMGVREFVRALLLGGVCRFAVATAEEGVAVRAQTPEAEILVLGGVQQGEEKLFATHHLTAALFDERPLPPDVAVHVKVNTGMNRLGLSPAAARRKVIELGSRVRAVFSHLASAGSDPEFTRLQLERFLKAVEGLEVPRHLSNSAGLKFSEASLEAVRVGLALHGIDQECDLGLRPVMKWKTRLLSTLEVARGEGVGYDRIFVTDRPTRLGVLPVGYADGYPSLLAGRVQVMVGECPVPLVGRLSMDLAAVDLTDAPDACRGAEAVLISSQPDSPVGVPNLCRLGGLSPWELLTGIGSRVERLYIS